MRKEHISENQLTMFVPTEHGYEKTCKFFGSDLTKKDDNRLSGNLKKVFEILLKIGWHTNEDLYRDSDIFNCDRYRRYISEGLIKGFTIEKKNFGNGIFKYRIIKLDNQI